MPPESSSLHADRAGSRSSIAADGPGDAVSDRPVRVRLVGLLPAILKPCGAACAQPFMNRPVETLADQEWEETPESLRENGERIHAIAEELFREFGRDVRIEVVGLDSPRGLLFAARHRIGGGFAVVVGREVVRDPRDYEPVREAVSKALNAARPASP